MPLDKLVLILIAVVAAAAITVWLGAMLMVAVDVSPLAWFIFLPAALVGYIIWRVVAERINSTEDDHYDGIDK